MPNSRRPRASASRVTWADVALPERQKHRLRAIAVVLRRRYPGSPGGTGGPRHRGQGAVALFAGLSGTGKTMAGQVLATESGRPLYRVDLSEVVSKHVGETEKNLRRAFDAAEESGAILFFDEADALFGRRSDVRDAHDRFGSIEVSYLLQRLESFSDLVILATKRKQNIDAAFLRRLRFVVDFPAPSQRRRRPSGFSIGRQV